MNKNLHTDPLSKVEAIHFITSYLESLSVVAEKSNLPELSRVLKRLLDAVFEREKEGMNNFSEMAEIIDFYQEGRGEGK